MKLKIFLTALLVSLTVVLSVVIGAAKPVSAKRWWTPPPVATVLTVPPPGPKQLGDPLNFVGMLRDVKNNPLVDFSADVYIDFDYVGQVSTDNNGTFNFQTNKKFPASEHVLSIRYRGDKQHLPSSATNRFVIEPSILKVQTVPPTAGVTVSIDNRSFETGADGTVGIPMYKVDRYSLSVNTDKFYNPTQRIEFGRWEAESFQPSRDVDIPSSDPILVGLNVFHQVSQTFIDLDGKPVDPKRITKITIKSAQGDVFSYPDGQMRWVPSSRIARRDSGLEVTQLQYSVMNVTVDGSNVVNQAQQRFFADQGDVWKIQLLLYSMNVNTRDALFGSPVGTSVDIEFPNGEVQTYPLDQAGTVQIRSLARGIYRIKVNGVKGVISYTPVALSRNQDAAMQVITNQDIAAAGGAGLVVVVGLLLIGRPWLLIPWLRRRRNVKHKNAPEPQPEPEGYIINNN